MTKKIVLKTWSRLTIQIQVKVDPMAMHNFEPFGMDVDITKQQSKTNENDTLAAMDRQRLHTRETNSGSLKLKTRKRVTISASGKKPQAQKSVPKQQYPLCQSKQAHLDENAFSFVETLTYESD
ncbi:hypothetical protein CTI12_AA599560 [Artemisia annua]|uniref:Uncharacterized protein n=1 Tax=Artemisia annua TaxID=35608 RepID=A0A2U1KI82_ARTAN|nr:hypothetical protein CTI12_AA599560 [Artemisia annua]